MGKLHYFFFNFTSLIRLDIGLLFEYWWGFNEPQGYIVLLTSEQSIWKFSTFSAATGLRLTDPTRGLTPRRIELKSCVQLKVRVYLYLIYIMSFTY